MTIHHNTIKRATSLGLKISEARDGRIAIEGEIIVGAETTFEFPAGTKASDALQGAYQARVYAKEYRIAVKQAANGDFHVQMPGGQSMKGTDLLDVLTRAVDAIEARRKAEQGTKVSKSKASAQDGGDEEGEDGEGDEEGDEDGEPEPDSSATSSATGKSPPSSSQAWFAERLRAGCPPSPGQADG